MALLTLVGVVMTPGCDKAPLLAPTNTTISLLASSSVVSLNGSTELFATVIESAGTAVQNGTVVRFVTNLGTIDPVEARTENGQATARLHAGTSSGTATVSAISGSARANDVTIEIGGAAIANLVVSANPATVPPGGGTVEITAIVSDANGNRIPGVLVAFGSPAGQLENQSVATNGNGEARTRLTTTRDAMVTASVGSLAPQAVNVTVESAPIVSLATVTATPTVGQVTTFTLTIAQGANGSTIELVTIDFGDGQSQTLGGLTGTLNIDHTYTAAGSYVVSVSASDRRQWHDQRVDDRDRRHLRGRGGGDRHAIHAVDQQPRRLHSDRDACVHGRHQLHVGLR